MSPSDRPEKTVLLLLVENRLELFVTFLKSRFFCNKM